MTGASSEGVAENAAARPLLLSLAIAGVTLLAVWAISPRFEIDVPSLVDDWAAYFTSPEQLADVLRLTNPETERFRPGVILWGYLQWHTLGAPESLLGPNAWNILRVAILVAGLTLFTALALPIRRGRIELLLYVGLASIPAFVVVLVPKFARDLARFGPQEPLLVGGMALGGSLLFLAARSLFDETRPVRTLAVAALAVAGAFAWALGTYQKETSICVLPLLAGVAIAAWPRLASWKRLSSTRKAALGALAAVVVLPLLHVGIELIRIVLRGDLVYDAEVAGGRGLVDGVRGLWDWTHEAVPENARLLAYGAVALVAVASVVRRRLDPIAVGALASGALTFVFAGQSGVLATRYYIPAVALFAVAFALSLARLPSIVVAAGVLAVFFSFMPPPETRNEVQRWTDEERANGALVQEATELVSANCIVAAGGLDEETTAALPVLVAVGQDTGGGCSYSDVYAVAGPGELGLALVSACVPGSLVTLVEAPVGSLYRCERLRQGAGPARLVAKNRLEPLSLD